MPTKPSSTSPTEMWNPKRTRIGRFFEWIIEQRLVVLSLMLLLTLGGLIVAPFDWGLSIPRHPVAVDAIPDIGENQQIVHIQWPGRSPQDIEDQLAYPLSTSLTSVSGVHTVRTQTMMGSASIYLIFDDKTEYYWSRTRVQEALNTAVSEGLPDGASVELGPPASALGQIYWYTLEGIDADGNPAGGWDLHELRKIQDYQVRFALREVRGVAEVASIGGFEQALVIEPRLEDLESRGITLDELHAALSQVSVEVGASSTEMQGIEYILRSEGFVRDIDAVRQALVRFEEGQPTTVDDVAHVSFQPRERQGFLDKDGAESVGGIVIARHGANPMEVASNVHEALEQLSSSLPRKTLSDGRISQLTVVPYLDRSTLIESTVGTLEEALTQAVLITIVVVLLMLAHIRSAALVAMLLPLAVLWTFLSMQVFQVTANVVSLAGIAIAIGTMVDLGIVMSENIVGRLRQRAPEVSLGVSISEACAEVAGAMLTALATTGLSFLPVFFLQGAGGKLFGPLAFTKTWALFFSFLVSVLVIPIAAYYFFDRRWDTRKWRSLAAFLSLGIGGVIIGFGYSLTGGLILLSGVLLLVHAFATARLQPEQQRFEIGARWALTFAAIAALASIWSPSGGTQSPLGNFVFVVVICLGSAGFFRLFSKAYPHILQFILARKRRFITVPATMVVLGLFMWMGAPTVASYVNANWQESVQDSALGRWFPGIGQEFMPDLNEGAFLYMPTTAPHASIGEVQRLSSLLTRRFSAIPEVESAVTKAGRADTALDPAPVSMLETVITYVPEFRVNASGQRLLFAVDKSGEFSRDSEGELVPSKTGMPYRQWRDHIRTTDDIWNEIVHAGDVPGLTGAPILQPISARVVMLQSGIRAASALRVRGQSLEQIYAHAEALEAYLRTHPAIASEAVVADRAAGRPYLVIKPDRQALAQYGLTLEQFQNAVEIGLAGKDVGVFYEGRARFPIRVRLARDHRQDLEAIRMLPVASYGGVPLALSAVAQVENEMGPVMTTTENGALVTWVMFSPREDIAVQTLVHQVESDLREAVRRGELTIDDGVRLDFVGSYESSLRAAARLKLLIPIALLIIFMLLKIQLKDTIVAVMVFTSVAIAASGGMIWLWLYGQPGFMDFSITGLHLRDIFHIQTTHLSVAVWVGFIALAGIAADDSVLMATWLQERFRASTPTTVEDIRAHVLDVGLRRLRPCLMTTATTLLALLPVLTSKGTGSDVMIPMAIPVFGGSLFALITLFVTPVLYSAWQERKLRQRA